MPLLLKTRGTFVRKTSRGTDSALKRVPDTRRHFSLILLQLCSTPKAVRSLLLIFNVCSLVTIEHSPVRVPSCRKSIVVRVLHFELTCDINYRRFVGIKERKQKKTKKQVLKREQVEQMYAIMLSWCSLLLCLGIVSQDVTANWFRATSKGNKLNVIHEWKYMDFLYDSEEQRQAAIKSGEYEPTSNSPIDVDRWNKETFVTIIRSKGVPSSLNTISNRTGNGGPLLKPYPDWSWTNTSNCDGITSVYRVAIDRCDRLWVLDNGFIGDTQSCSAQLLAFDLNTSKLLKRVKIPDNIAQNSTTGKGILVTPVVQTFGRNCRHTNVFIADVDGYALIVYDGLSLKRLTSSSLVYDPKATNYTIEGQSFQLEDGPVGMALSPWTGRLYFSPMSSFNLAAVNSREITLPESDVAQFRSYNDILTTQASAKAMSKTGALFFGLVNDTSIGCWNEFRPLNRNNIDVAAKNRTTLQFTSGLKVKDSEEGEVLLAFSNRYQKLATGTLNVTEVNFRILSGLVKNVLEGTKCQSHYSFYPGIAP